MCMSRPLHNSKKRANGVDQTSDTWRPVKRVQLDVNTLTSIAPFDVTNGDRLWIEALRNGRVVGVIDARVEDDELPATVFKKLNDLKEQDFMSLELLPDELLMKASVVVPTICENPDELVRTVESLLAQDYPDFEIIVVDNRSGIDGEPLPTFRGGSRVRVFAESKPGVSAARNCGISKSIGDFIAFTDDDAVVDPNWLRAIGSRFVLDSEIEAIGGLVLPMELDTAPQMWFEEFYGGFSPSFQFEKLSIELLRGVDEMFPYAIGRFGAGCNMAFRRATLERIGDFNIYLGGGTLSRSGEDLALAVELVVTGGTFAFEPSAIVRHTHRRTETEFFKQVFNYGTGLTAIYTAMIVRDPRHLVAMARRIPAGLRHLTRSPGERSQSATRSYPRRTLVYQVVGMLYGPIAYGRSVARTRWFS